jgi:hypothetical protein
MFFIYLYKNRNLLKVGGRERRENDGGGEPNLGTL